MWPGCQCGGKRWDVCFFYKGPACERRRLEALIHAQMIVRSNRSLWETSKPARRRMNNRKLAPISTQTGGAQIPRHARYPLRPPTPHAQPSAYRGQWLQQNLRSLAVGPRCPQESPPISSRCGQRKSSRGQTQILDVPTKASSPPHHEPNHMLYQTLCREAIRKGTRTFQSATAVQVPSDSSSCHIFMRWSREQVARRTP